MFKRSLKVLSLLLITGTSAAYADCVDGSSVAEVRQSYSEGQALEQAGRTGDAVRAYLQAQNYVCGAENPVALDAAKKAAPIALRLAQEQESKKRLLSPAGRDSKWEDYGAFEWYQAGGHFKEADRVLITALRANPGDFSLYEKARQHFSERVLASFAQNYQERIEAVGGYALERKLYDEVHGLPAINFENSLKGEDKAFKEDYLKDSAALYQKRPTNMMNFVAVQQAETAARASASKWRQDPIKASIDKLEEARRWATAVSVDSGPSDAMQEKSRQRAVERGDLILNRYASTPDLLEKALDYYSWAQAEGKTELARKQADQLGDDALNKGRFEAAAAFYRISRNSDKADLAEARLEEQRNAQTASLQEQYEQKAEALKQTYGDPAKIAEMRRKAEEMKTNLEKTPEQQKQFQKEQDDLESELGM